MTLRQRFGWGGPTASYIKHGRLEVVIGSYTCAVSIRGSAHCDINLKVTRVTTDGRQ